LQCLYGFTCFSYEWHSLESVMVMKAQLSILYQLYSSFTAALGSSHKKSIWTHTNTANTIFVNTFVHSFTVPGAPSTGIYVFMGTFDTYIGYFHNIIFCLKKKKVNIILCTYWPTYCTPFNFECKTAFYFNSIPYTISASLNFLFLIN
jgi:hypothetical protein